MPSLCTLAGHVPQTIRHHNQGLDFTRCHHCGCDLIRAEDGEWAELPKGFRVVWREIGRADDAGSVAERMRRMAPPPRRGPRTALPTPRRDPRGLPLRGAASLIGSLAGLRALLASHEPIPDDRSCASDAGDLQVIHLPHRTG